MKTKDEINLEFRGIISHALLGEEENISKQGWKLILQECTKFTIEFANQKAGEMVEKFIKDAMAYVDPGGNKDVLEFKRHWLSENGLGDAEWIPDKNTWVLNYSKDVTTKRQEGSEK